MKSLKLSLVTAILALLSFTYTKAALIRVNTQSLVSLSDTITLFYGDSTLLSYEAGYSFKSDNPFCASVNEIGKVKALHLGTANITISSPRGNRTIPVIVKSEITPPAPFDNLEILIGKSIEEVDKIFDTEIKIELKKESPKEISYLKKVSEVVSVIAIVRFDKNDRAVSIELFFPDTSLKKKEVATFALGLIEYHLQKYRASPGMGNGYISFTNPESLGRGVIIYQRFDNHDMIFYYKKDSKSD